MTFSKGFFIYGFYDVEVLSFFYSYLLNFFITRNRWILANSCFFHQLRWLFFSFLLLLWYYAAQFCMLNHPWIPEINPTLSWYMIWFWFASILLRMFAIIFKREMFSLFISIHIVLLECLYLAFIKGYVIFIEKRKHFQFIRRVWGGSIN